MLTMKAEMISFNVAFLFLLTFVSVKVVTIVVIDIDLYENYAYPSCEQGMSHAIVWTAFMYCH